MTTSRIAYSKSEFQRASHNVYKCREYENRRSVGPGPTNIRPDRQSFLKLVGPADRQKNAHYFTLMLFRTDKKSAGPTEYWTCRSDGPTQILWFSHSLQVYVNLNVRN